MLTAGPWTGDLTSELRPFAKPERQVPLWVQPVVPAHFQLDTFPVFYLEGDEGRFYGFPIYSTPGFKIGKYHHLREQVQPDSVDRVCHPRDEDALRQGIRRYFPGADGPTLAMKVCMFTNTPDGHFVIDHHPDSRSVVVAAGFSGHGFKFCSVVGEVLTPDLLRGGSGQRLNL